MTERISPNAVRVFVDTSVVIAGCFSSSGASFAVLQLAGLGLIDARVSPLVRLEAVRNVAAKLPSALPALGVLLSEALTEAPGPTDADTNLVETHAHTKDVPILAAAVAQGCRYLITLNERDFSPPKDMIEVVSPGAMIERFRTLIRDG